MGCQLQRCGPSIWLDHDGHLVPLAQNLATIPCFVKKVQGYVALLEDVDSALLDAVVTAYI